MPDTPTFLFPRLPGLLAHDRYLQIEDLQPAELGSHCRVQHERAEFAPTGGHHVPEDTLSLLRDEVLELASGLGFPDERTRLNAAAFDAACAALLHQHLPIMPAEAARNEVWSFLTLVVMPDVARWRFPSAGEGRFLGGVRNTFQRLWWRAKVFHDERSDDPYSLLRDLDEDVMVGIMERPGISSNELLARTLGYAAVAMSQSVDKSQLEDARRDALKRVRQRIPVVCLETLTEARLTDQVNSLFAEAAAAFQ